MIKRFHVLYVGQIDLDNVGLQGTPANERRYSNDRFAEVFWTARRMARVMDETGYHALWTAEHHFQHEGYECLPNLIQLGLWLATQTEKLKFGCGFNVLPTRGPPIFGRRSSLRSDALRISPRSIGWSTVTALIVSIATPVKRVFCQRSAALEGRSKVTSKRVVPRIIGEREHLQVAGRGRLDVEGANLAIELDQNVARLAETVLTFKHLRDACRNILGEIARLARVTITAESPRVSIPMSWCGRIASTTRSVGTAPRVPRSGARKIGTSATGPAFSTRSPMRTISPVTVTFPRSAGIAFCAAAGLANVPIRAKARAKARNCRTGRIIGWILLSASIARSSAASRRLR